MKISFGSKVALVAGGTGGLGRAVSLAFLREGATVVVPYHHETEFTALCAKLPAKHAAALEGQPLDVTDEAAVGRFVADLMARHGSLDAVVNTVGGYAGGIKLWELETKTFDTMLALNLRAGFVLARAVLPALLKQGHGSLVNVAAKAAFDHGGGAAAYAASKAAAVAMMNCTGRGHERHRGASEFHPAQHHRYAGEPAGYARRRFRCAGPSPRISPGDSVPLQ